MRIYYERGDLAMLWLLIGAGCLAVAAFWIIVISSSRQDLPRCGST